MALRSDSNANSYTTMTIFKSDNYKSFPRTSTCCCVGFPPLPPKLYFLMQLWESFLCIRQYNKHSRASGAYRETQRARNKEWKCFTLIELCFAVVVFNWVWQVSPQLQVLWFMFQKCCARWALWSLTEVYWES